MKSSLFKDIKRKTSNFAPYFMIFPTIALLCIFSLYPVGLSIVKSLFRWSGGFNNSGINEFVGFGNYLQLFKDSVFWQSWGNALFFMITGLIINMIFPFLCAFMIFAIKNDKASYRWRVAFIAPMVVPSMVVFLLWQFIYDVDIGVVNNFLKLFGAKKGLDLLGNAKSVKWAIRFMGFPWVGGTYLLIFVAALSNVDNSLREAAKIDGANSFIQLTHIDVPLCKPQFKMVFTLTIIGEVQDFVKIQTVTGGGPGYYSYVPGLYMYKTAFDSGEYGLASAMGVIMMLVMLFLTYMSNVLFKTEAAE